MSDIREFPMPSPVVARPNRIDFAGILIEAAERQPGAPEGPPRCSGCGELNHLHQDTTGVFWIGCMGALRRKELGLTDEQPRYADLWSDRHPSVSRVVRLLLSTACGHVTELFNNLPQDQQMEMARLLARFAVDAQIAEDAKGNR